MLFSKRPMSLYDFSSSSQLFSSFKQMQLNRLPGYSLKPSPCTNFCFLSFMLRPVGIQWCNFAYICAQMIPFSPLEVGWEERKPAFPIQNPKRIVDWRNDSRGSGRLGIEYLGMDINTMICYLHIHRIHVAEKVRKKASSSKAKLEHSLLAPLPVKMQSQHI